MKEEKSGKIFLYSKFGFEKVFSNMKMFFLIFSSYMSNSWALLLFFTNLGWMCSHV